MDRYFGPVTKKEAVYITDNIMESEDLRPLLEDLFHGKIEPADFVYYVQALAESEDEAMRAGRQEDSYVAMYGESD